MFRFLFNYPKKQTIMYLTIWDDLPKHPTKTYRKRSLDKIDTIVVHHSGGAQGTPEGFARYHVETKGWPGIAYHLVIDRSGIIYRTQRIDTVSYHVHKNNTHCIGICLVGNFQVQKPTQNQEAALYELVASLRDILGDLKVKGHRDFKATDCPGDNLYELINTYA